MTRGLYLVDNVIDVAHAAVPLWVRVHLPYYLPFLFFRKRRAL